MIVVVSAAAIPEHLRGYVSRFMVQVDANLFVGNLTPKIADAIWSDLIRYSGCGSITMVREDRSQELEFSVATHGPRRAFVPVDLDGLMLMSRLRAPQNRRS